MPLHALQLAFEALVDDLVVVDDDFDAAEKIGVNFRCRGGLDVEFLVECFGDVGDLRFGDFLGGDDEDVGEAAVQLLGFEEAVINPRHER